MRKVFTYLLVMIILLNVVPVKVYAGDGGGFFTDDAFKREDVTLNYYMENDSSIPSGNHFFYKYKEGYAWYCSLQEALALCANKSYGISLNTDVLVALATHFEDYCLSYTGSAPSINRVKKSGGYVGYALNNLTGCKILNPAPDDQFSVDSDANNFIYVYVHDYLQENYSKPDYIILNGPTCTEFAPKIGGAVPNYDRYYNAVSSNPKYLFDACYYAHGYDYFCTSYGFQPYQVRLVNDGDFSFYARTGFDDICNIFNLNYSKYTITFNDVINQIGSTKDTVFTAYLVDSSSGTVGCTYRELKSSSVDNTVTSSDPITVLSIDSYKASMMIGQEDHYTIYRDQGVFNNVVHNTYSPKYFDSRNYIEYDSSSTTNNFDSSVSNVDNSVTTNENIYNQSQDYFNQQVSSESNYNIDVQNITENVTQYITYYYGDSSGDDDSGGGSSGSGDGSGDDSGIFDALLGSISGLFKTLGKVIAAILTGIIDLITTVLESLTGIIEAINPFNALLTALFGFLPEIVVNTIASGLSICVMLAVIKFLRG